MGADALRAGAPGRSTDTIGILVSDSESSIGHCRRGSGGHRHGIKPTATYPTAKNDGPEDFTAGPAFWRVTKTILACCGMPHPEDLGPGEEGAGGRMHPHDLAEPAPESAE
jgi:hypothetical protein